MQKRQSEFGKRLKAFMPIAWELIPDLGLYMDQVVTFVERQCKSLYQDGERIFTPSMVNNYVKQGIINRPVDKKYGRDQLAQLLMVCTLKQAASAEGMKRLLALPQSATVEAQYREFCEIQHEVFSGLADELPLSTAMTCAVRNAAYRFLCNAMLGKEEQPVKAQEEAGKDEKT